MGADDVKPGRATVNGEAAREQAQIDRLHLAISDMDDTAMVARYLISSSDDLHWQLRLVLQTGMFTTYARAFNTSKGTSSLAPLPAAPTRGLSKAQREVHKWAITERNTAWAHVDRSGGRQILGVHARRPEGMKLVRRERVRPANADELAKLADLAEELAARYRAELDEIDAAGTL